MEPLIALLALLGILGLIDAAALLWGADSRDGRDWRTDPHLDALVWRRSR